MRRALVAALRDAGLQVLATTLDGEIDLDDAAIWPTPTAWLFGSEAHGLPADVAALADARVRIPMRGARRASMSLRPRRSACTRAHGHAH